MEYASIAHTRIGFHVGKKHRRVEFLGIRVTIFNTTNSAHLELHFILR